MIEDIPGSSYKTTTFELHEKHCLDFLNLVNHKIMLTSFDRKVVFANKSAEEWIDSTSKPLGNCRCYNIIHGTDKPSVHCGKCSVYEGGVSECSRIDIRQSNRMLDSVKAFPLKKSARGIRHILYVFNSSENEAESIKKIFDSKMLYIKSILHDFNNLLMCINLNTENARDIAADNGPLCEMLDNCIIASRQSSILLNNLSSFLKDGSDLRNRLSVKKVCARNVIEESAGLLLRSNALSFSCSTGMGNAFVRGDSIQLSQLFNNLLMNAREAVAGKDGMITAALSDISLKAGNQYGLAKGDYVKIAVTDNGKGIEKDSMTHIFDPYFTTKKNGNGLGLSICSWIAQCHNGAITVESELDTGTVFTVILPAWSDN